MRRARIIIVALALTFAACSSDNSNGGTTQASTGGSINGGGANTGGSSGGASNNGGTVNVGGQALQGGTASCPPWPKGKLFPNVGPYFYGPSPGPCTITSQGNVYTVTYDSLNRPVQQATSDNANVFTYSYTGGLLIGETDITGTGQTDITYQYSDTAASYTNSGSTGVMSTYTYALDAQGYPQAISAQGPMIGASSPTRYQFVYENCRIIERVAFMADNTESAANHLYYTYDSQGRVIERRSSLTDETFDYSCW